VPPSEIPGDQEIPIIVSLVIDKRFIKFKGASGEIQILALPPGGEGKDYP
jgi:hypothetical protein